MDNFGIIEVFALKKCQKLGNFQTNFYLYSLYVYVYIL